MKDDDVTRTHSPTKLNRYLFGKDLIADFDGRLHRSRGNHVRLDDKRTDEKRCGAGNDNDDQPFGKTSEERTVMRRHDGSNSRYSAGIT